MKVGLLSDTHGWLDSGFHQWFAGVEMILHAGDVGSEVVLTELEVIAPTYAVRGNVDGGRWAMELPLERVVEVGGLRIAMLHIAGEPGRPEVAATALLARERPDMLLVGHTHIPVMERLGRGGLWLNPGAAGRQGFHTKRTAALLHIEEGALPRVEMIELGTRSR
jgi:putative phosphoesterase